MQIPQVVQDLIGDALTPINLKKWWESPNVALEGSSPMKLWEEGSAGQDRVCNLIQAAKSGDMA